MNFLKIVLISSMGFIILGCSTPQPKVPEKVYIPVKCSLNIPKRPLKNNYKEDIINILIYTEKLERVIDVCVKK